MKALILYSGGLDSTCLLYHFARMLDTENVYALNITYGQKHPIERECARWHAKELNLGDRYIEEDLSRVFKFDYSCSLLKGSKNEVPDGSYEEQQKESHGPVSTYVPFRNGLFASYAVAVAYQLDVDIVAMAIHQGDTVAEAYPDCSPAFADALNEAIKLGTDGKVQLLTPFVNLTKSKVVSAGVIAGMTEHDFEHTHSCYKGIPGGCGSCATCLERRKALEDNKIFLSHQYSEKLTK